MDYMAQKMDEQIEGSLHEQERKGNEIEAALEVIKQAMIDDNPSEPGSYAHSWHCNIAMMCHDAIYAATGVIDKGLLSADAGHIIGNDAASRFMKLCFGVETK